MHAQAYAYVARTVAKYGPFRSIVDLGGANINGVPKALFGRYLSYIAVDLYPNAGVDIVANAADWVPNPEHLFDCVVSTELLEHTPQGEEIIHNMARILREHPLTVDTQGRAIITCASSPRSPHSAWGLPQLKPDEYYGNVEPEDVQRWLEEAGFEEIEVEKHIYPDHGGDLYATGIIRL